MRQECSIPFTKVQSQEIVSSRAVKSDGKEDLSSLLINLVMNVSHVLFPLLLSDLSFQGLPTNATELSEGGSWK